MLAQRLGLPEGVQQAVRHTLERWDGKGIVYGLKGDLAPVAARVLHIAQVLDAVYTLGGAQAGVSVARERRGTDFDPEMAGAFLELSSSAGFWEELDQDSLQETVLAMRPTASFDSISEAHVDGVCEALADLTDITFPWSWNHSQKVADAAVGIGRSIGMNEEKTTLLRRAGLVHDLGKIAVLTGVREKKERQQKIAGSDWEQFRLHPYYTERVLARVDRLRVLGTDAVANHEWLNGDGYPKQLSGEQISISGKILAVADVYTELSTRHDGLGDPRGVLEEMRPLLGSSWTLPATKPLSPRWTRESRHTSAAPEVSTLAA